MANDSKSYASGKPMAAGEGTVDKVLTPANVVTLVRICLVPVFIVALIGPWPEAFGCAWLDPWKAWVAAIIFVVISCTDWLDGYLARSRGEVTDFGKFMDPLADKVLVVAALLVLVELGSLPSWPVIIIVAREFIVSGVRMVAASKGEVIAASWYGKFKTVFTMIAIVLFVVKESPAVLSIISEPGAVALWVLSWVVMVIALALTIVSMMDYIWKARHLIGFKPKRSKMADADVQGDTQDADAVEEPVQASHDAIWGEVALGNLDAAESLARELCVDTARRVVEKACEAHVTLGTAESCTGGLISAALTDVPGSSAVVMGSIVSYANDVKAERLGVPADVLESCGAVSEPVALHMARGARRALNADIAVSVTGIAGPGGAVPGKPVGTVWVAIAGPKGARAFLHHFDGDRRAVRAQTAQAALELMESAIVSMREENRE